MPDMLELAWAAGFFDGEGHLGFRWKKGPRGRCYPTLYCDFTQIHPEVLERFRDAVGTGYVTGPYGPYPRNINASPRYCYRAMSRQLVQPIIDRLYPFLSSVKRAQIDDALTTYQAAELEIRAIRRELRDAA